MELTTRNCYDNDFRLPECADEIIKAGTPDTRNAYLSHRDACWETYSFAYQRAYEILLDGMLGSERFEYDNSLIYPVMFLARQAIELKMKTVVSVATIILDMEEDTIPSHRLHQIFDTMSHYLCTIFPNDQHLKKSLLKSRKSITQFTQIDPHAQLFRYPYDRKKNRLDLGCVDLSALKDSLHEINVFLDSAWYKEGIALDEKYMERNPTPLEMACIYENECWIQKEYFDYCLALIEDSPFCTCP